MKDTHYLVQVSGESPDGSIEHECSFFKIEIGKETELFEMMKEFLDDENYGNVIFDINKTIDVENDEDVS